MSIVLDGTSGLTSPAAVLTTTPLAVTSGGTGVTTSTGTGANVLGTSPTITGATVTVAATAAPAFSAYMSTSQSITTTTFTKVQCNTEEFDTNSNYDNATNYRFTPTVSGYYQVNCRFDTLYNATITFVALYKNGVEYKRGADYRFSVTVATGVSSSYLVFLNGSTDYIEMYAFITGTSPSIEGSSNSCYFQAAMIRSA
jgi:hypothetical protein